MGDDKIMMGELFDSCVKTIKKCNLQEEYSTEGKYRDGLMSFFV